MLLGGAVGDALGAPVEFLSLTEIRERFGPQGITDLVPAYGRSAGAVTDDTQLTLFVFEGLIRAQVRFQGRGICNPVAVIEHALLRWAATQGIELPLQRRDLLDGWLFEQNVLHVRRAPGATCLAALRALASGQPERNDSKGCGTVMRSAPFAVCREGSAYDLASQSSMSTHGHPVAADAAGCFAEMCRILVGGASIIEAVTSVEPATDEVHESLLAAERFVRSARGIAPAAELFEVLGAGWVAEEALAMGAAAALLAEDLETGSNEDRVSFGLRFAVNHSGDSDSTGSVAGNLLGARYGTGAIPDRWLRALEVRDIISELVAAWELQAQDPGWAHGLRMTSPDGESETLNLITESVEQQLRALHDRFPGW